MFFAPVIRPSSFSRTAPAILCSAALLALTLSARAEETLTGNPEFKRAVAAYNENRFEESESLFEKLAQEFPDNSVILNNLAVIAANRGSTARAVKLLKRTIATDAAINTAYHNLSAIYTHLASLAYQRALSLKPLNPDPLQLQLIGETPRAAPPIIDLAGAVTQTKEVDKPLVLDPKTPGNTREHQSVVNAVMRWAQAWSRQDLDTYFMSYIDGYAPPGISHRSWKAQRTRRVRNPRFITVAISEIRARSSKKTEARVTFRQKYRSNLLSSSVIKQLEMRNVNNVWKITEERVL